MKTMTEPLLLPEAAWRGVVVLVGRVVVVLAMVVIGRVMVVAVERVRVVVSVVYRRALPCHTANLDGTGK